MQRAGVAAGLAMVVVTMAAAEGKPLSVVKEWDGAYSAQPEAKRIVVKDEKAWEEVWQAMYGNVRPMPVIEKVDFEANMVIAVFMGTRNSGGYGIRITGIDEDGKITAKVKQHSPPPDAMLTMALTAPFHVVVVPKSDKPVEFADEK